MSFVRGLFTCYDLIVIMSVQVIHHTAFTASAIFRPLKIKITCTAQTNALQRWTVFGVDNAFYFILCHFFLQNSNFGFVNLFTRMS